MDIIMKLAVDIILIFILLDIHIILFCYMLRTVLQTVNLFNKYTKGKEKTQNYIDKSNEKKDANSCQEKTYPNKVFYDIKKPEHMEKDNKYSPNFEKKPKEVPETKVLYAPIPTKTDENVEMTRIRLGNVAEGGMNIYGINESVKEKKDGELKVLSMEDKIVYVMPYNSLLTEQTFKNTLVEKYFTISQRIIPGCKYKVKKESKAATLKRQGDAYFLVNRGYLELEEYL